MESGRSMATTLMLRRSSKMKLLMLRWMDDSDKQLCITALHPIMPTETSSFQGCSWQESSFIPLLVLS